MSEVEASVLGQCLEFTSNVLRSNKSFSFHIKMSNGFNFNFCNTEKRNSLLKDSKLKKKPSPSTLARNKIRMEKFIAKKKASALNAKSGPSTDKESSNVTLKDSDAIATSTFKCDLCDYENHTKKGLSCHIAQKHKEKQQQGVPSPIPQLDGRYDDTISQLDGHNDTEVEESETNITLCKICPANSGYCLCGKCEECEYFATEKGYNIHIMNDHEPDEVYQHFGMDWINSHFKYVKRNFNYAQDRVHFEKWESFMAGKG